MKAIITQKSTILPYINIHKISGSLQKGRASKEISKSRQIEQQKSIDNHWQFFNFIQIWWEENNNNHKWIFDD